MGFLATGEGTEEVGVLEVLGVMIALWVVEGEEDPQPAATIAMTTRTVADVALILGIPT